MMSRRLVIYLVLLGDIEVCRYVNYSISRKTFILGYYILRKEIEQDCGYPSSIGVVESGHFVGADGNIIGVLSGLVGVANNSFSLDFL